MATRGVQIGFDGARGAIDLASGTIGLLEGRLRPRRSPRPQRPRANPATAGSPAGTAGSTAAEKLRAQRASGHGAGERTSPTPPRAVEDEPEDQRPAGPPAPGAGHVTAEAELVRESAEPGAEDGAGAQVRVAEPWRGYRAMSAADVVDRLATASREQLAAVELFELAGRRRKSVLAAAERALRRHSPPQQA